VLEWVLDPNMGGIHPGLFGPSLKGICFINIVEVGFVFSGNVGTGILMARREDGSWSPPSSIGVSGIGWGFIMGASLKEIVYLIYDESTLKAMAGDMGVKLGTQTEASLGNWGRTADMTNFLTNKGVAPNIALSYSQGIFGGLSIEGAVCKPRSKVNEKFYGKKISPTEILFGEGEGAVEVPDGNHLMPEVYAKLEKLCSGVDVYEITEEEKSKAETVRLEADEEGEEHLKDEDVTFVVVEDEVRQANKEEAK
jgi:lipid-binding SYLF domain-containing protein